jgi:hypothetical protein
MSLDISVRNVMGYGPDDRCSFPSNIKNFCSLPAPFSDLQSPVHSLLGAIPQEIKQSKPEFGLSLQSNVEIKSVW